MIGNLTMSPGKIMQVDCKIETYTKKFVLIQQSKKTILVLFFHIEVFFEFFLQKVELFYFSFFLLIQYEVCIF